MGFSGQLNGKLLDIGCGSKPYESLFDVTEYVGLDLERTGHRKGVDVTYDGKTFPFENESFDSAFSSQVLEHVFTPYEFVEEIQRVLKPGGKLLLTVPFVWDEHEQPWDYARYSSFAIKELFEKRGFKILTHEKTSSDLSVLFQLYNTYLYKLIKPSRLPFKNTLIMVMTAPSNILGRLCQILFPKNPDLYLDHIVLMEKVN